MIEKDLSFEELGFSYEPGQWVLRGYGGKVEHSKVFAILGPNGCGKTTLLKLLIGLLRPQEGRVRNMGRIAFVPQLFQVSFAYTVFDMVLMGRVRRVGLFSTPSATDERAAFSALEKMGLADLAERPFDQLSGGQRQLVIFARALATEAGTLILDEPTAALDLRNQRVILNWISRLAHEEGLAVVFTTHHPHHAFAAADTTLLMLGEREFLSGPTAQVMTEGHLRSLYGVDLKRLTFQNNGRKMETFVPVYDA
ncbi:MAG: ABC transporter ATP-binding protein [Desulfatiglandales bacterium]